MNHLPMTKLLTIRFWWTTNILFSLCWYWSLRISRFVPNTWRDYYRMSCAYAIALTITEALVLSFLPHLYTNDEYQVNEKFMSSIDKKVLPFIFYDRYNMLASILLIGRLFISIQSNSSHYSLKLCSLTSLSVCNVTLVNHVPIHCISNRHPCCIYRIMKVSIVR